MVILPKTSKQPRRTKQPAHVPKSVLAALTDRDCHACAWKHEPGEQCDPETLVPQHRHGGAGGRRGKHRLSNLLWLDSRKNGEIESDADLQAEALRRGIKISLHADPEFVPVLHAVHGIVLLDDNGGITRKTVR